MAQKYEIQYYDVANVLHKIEIYKDDYVGSVIDIQGTCVLSYLRTDEPLEPIRGSSLRIDLEANVGLTFEEFYTNNEKTFNVKYYRNSVIKFNGWVNPNGWYEDYVRDQWVVGFDCIDGLGYLQDLAFLNDAGEEVDEALTLIEIISLALKRTGLEQDIWVDIDIRYTGLTTSDQMLVKTLIDADRFLEDDGITVTSCYSILESVLNLFTATLTLKDSKWYIYRTNKVSDSPIGTYEKYSFEGTYQGKIYSVDISEQIGSDVNNIPIHFVNNNQSIGVQNTIGAYKINYEYKFKQNLIVNNTFCTSNGTTIYAWTIVKTGVVSFPDYVSGELCGGMRLIGDSSNSTDVVLAPQTNNQFPFNAGNSLLINFSGFHQGYSLYIPGINTSFKVRVRLVSTADTYYLTQSGEWDVAALSTSYFIFKIQTNLSVDFNFEIEVPPLPIDGYISYDILDPNMEGSPYQGQYFDLHSTTLKLNPDTEAKGEVHIFTRGSDISSEVIPVKDVINGDSDSVGYNGTLYEYSPFFSPGPATTTWFRDGETEALPLLRIMGEETMKMTPVPCRVFSGDVFGYVDYLSVIEIDGLTGSWTIIGYSYDTYRNITSLVLREIYNGDLVDLDYQYELNQGNVIKPTIKE